MGQIAIVSFQSSGPKVIECFNVESRILCMVYIPEEEKLKERNMSLDSENVPAKASNVPTICLGMEEGRWFSFSVYYIWLALLLYQKCVRCFLEHVFFLRMYSWIPNDINSSFPPKSRKNTLHMILKYTLYYIKWI